MRALICRLPVALLAVVALWTLSALPTHAEGERGPINVAVRFRLNDILKFDPASGFTVDAFVGFVCDRPCGELNIVVGNGKESSRQVLADLPTAKAYRMELALTDVVDLHRYPFDSQPVAILLASSRSADELRFVADNDESGLGIIRLQGWEVDPSWHAQAQVVPNGPFAQRSIPVYEFGVTLARPPLAGFFKTILPSLAILIVGSFGLIIGPEERIKRFYLFNAAFLGTVLFQLNVLSGLPPLSYRTFADRFLLINLVSIILGVGSSVWIILAYRSGNKARSWMVHEWSACIIPLVWLSAQILNWLTVYVWSPSDPRVWAVGVGALAIIAGLIPWRRRATRLSVWFRTAYRSGLRQSRSPQTALAQVLDIVASIPPFDVLSKADLDALAEIFAPLPDPAVLVDVLVEAQRTNDVSVLRDRAALERFAAYVTGARAECPKPASATGTSVRETSRAA